MKFLVSPQPLPSVKVDLKLCSYIFFAQPYGPASRLSPYEDYHFHYDEEERRTPVSTQSATTQTISTIYDPHVISEETRSTADYPLKENYISCDVNRILRATSVDRMETLRKSTLV